MEIKWPNILWDRQWEWILWSQRENADVLLCRNWLLKRWIFRQNSWNITRI